MVIAKTDKMIGREKDGMAKRKQDSKTLDPRSSEE